MMKDQIKKNFSHMAQRRMVVEMIDAGFMLADKLGSHPLTKGCSCIHCIHKRKRILKPAKTDWKFKL
jgi:hypothetical protein